MQKSLKVILHIAFWSFFIWISMSLQTTERVFMKRMGPMADEKVDEFAQLTSEPNLIIAVLSDTAFKMVLVYTVILVLIPSYFAKRKYQQLIFWLLILFIATLALSLISEYLVSEYLFVSELYKWSDRFQNNSIILHVVLVSIALIYSFSRQWQISERVKQQLKNDSLSAELAVLKAQINPHFLFNTLNNLFAMARKSNDTRLADSLSQLSGIMRYMLYDNGQTTVSIKQEVSYIHDFIELSKLRVTQENFDRIRFDVKGMDSEFFIPPLILLPFVENAFKYGLSTHEPFEVKIDLEIIGKELKFNVINSINQKARLRNNKESSGIGLKNVRRRLELLYPDQHELEIADEGSFFKIKLMLNKV